MNELHSPEHAAGSRRGREGDEETMTAKLDPWHDCPPCPKCALTIGSPASESHPQFKIRERDVLFCAACGHAWHEDDPARVEQAWKAWRAWEREEERQQREAKLAAKAETEKRLLAEYERTWGK